MLKFKFLSIAAFVVRRLCNNYNELRKHQKAILVPFVVLLSLFTAISQGIDPDQQISPEITPPSPTAYELGKYGQIPVGEFTGTVNTSVPLYTYKTRNLSVPLSLSYSSNGIKVDQKETNVGLGWSLNAGGVITRIIRDEPDELSTVFFPEEELSNVGLSSPMALDYFQSISTNQADSEIDLYLYNFNGWTGKFVFDNNKIPILIPHNNLKIEVLQQGLIQGFNVTTPDGVKYEFTEIETSVSRMEKAGTHYPPGPNGPTAWYLTKIIHPYGDEIYFNYTGYTDSYTTSRSQSLVVRTTQPEPRPHYCPQPGNTSYEVEGITSHELTISGKAIQSISSNVPSEGSIIINGTTLISSIEIKGVNNTLLESFGFDYVTTNNGRTFLESVQFKDPQKNYNFEYYEPGNLAPRLSLSQDHWGYYNGVNNNHLFPNPKDLKLTDNRLSYYDFGADKEPNEDFAKKGLLKKVIYPTKGYTQISYEGNSYYGIKSEYPEPVTEYLSINTGFQDSGTTTESMILQNIKFNQEVEINKSLLYHSTGNCNPNGLPPHHLKMTISIVDLTQPTNTNIFHKRTPVGDISLNNSFQVSPNNNPDQVFMELLKNHQYELKLTVNNICIDANLGFTYYEGDLQEVQTSIPLGGLRVKTIEDYAPETGNSNYRRYYYGNKENINISTADKGVIPYYLSNRTIRYKCDEGDINDPICEYWDEHFIAINSNSVRTLFNSINNTNTYYNFVTTSFGGDNFENGGLEREFSVEPDYPGNPLRGEYIASAPWTNFGWSNGLELKATTFSKDNLGNFDLVSEVENSYKKDNRHKREVKGHSVRKNFDLYCPYDASYLCTAEDVTKFFEFGFCTTNHIHIYVPTFSVKKCIAVNSNNIDFTINHPCFGKPINSELTFPLYLENLDITEYKTISHWYYLESTTEKSYDENGLNPVSKTTDYFYENQEHLQLTKQRTTNSDGKIYETRYKYYDTYNSNDNIKTWLQNNNIIEPWNTVTYVYDNANDASGTAIDGTRFYYHNFGTSGNNLTYYPKTFQRYERTWNANGVLQTGNWENQYKINNYNIGVGRPASITVDGWSDPTTYTWTSTGNLNTKTYKSFVTDYNYHPNTDLLSEIIEPDGQSTTFTYDNFMRLDEIKSRAGKIKKDYNYSYNPNFIEEISTFNDVGTANDITNRVKTTFDGLGRDIQIDKVGHKWNHANTSISIFKAYDNRGLLSKVYEPVDDADTTGNTFTKYTYYPDPLNRIQTVTSPEKFETAYSYGTNASKTCGFNAGTLRRETITDADNIATITYTDKLGRVIATQMHSGNETSITCYRYDDKSRVSTVIPPGATISNANLIYKYVYDGADNILSTKFPDKDLMEYRYDNRNLQTAMRDANIKAKGKKWLNSQYDAYGRLHKQGFGASVGTVTDLLIHNYYDNNDNINAINTATPIYKGKLHKSRVNILNGFNKSNYYLTTAYALDNYGRISTESLTSNHINLPESMEYTYDMADNILTNKHTIGTGGNKNETIESFEYDSKGRLKNNYFKLNNSAQRAIANYASYSLKDEVLSKNMGRNYNNNGYLQTADFAYNHNGWLSTINGGSIIGTKSNCSAINAIASGDLFALDIRYNNAALSGHVDRKNGNISEIYWQVKDRAKNAYRFKYDFLNRITEAKHYAKNPELVGNNLTYSGQYDTGYSYDERGNIMSLSRKGLTGNGTSCGAKQIDNLSYMYEAGTNKLAKVFDSACGGAGQHINPINGTNYNKRYITSDAKTNVSGGNTNNSAIQFKGGAYITLKEGFSYDIGTGNSKFDGIIDPCPTNNDLTNNGFKGTESNYQYDGNGNLIKDSQKQLSISYNHLNLPYKAQKNGNNKIEWIYTADGRKLRKKATTNGQVKTKNYVGNMEFTQNGGINTLEAAYHSEGRVLNNGYWEYNLKDHLGNVRVVFVENGSSGNAYITQENHYYPFGMEFNGNWAKNQSVKNDYLYNGKELNTEIGLNWSDYGARFYDPVVGRWNGVDPLANAMPSWSAYSYTFNNPILFIDPNGQFPIKVSVRSFAPFKWFGARGWQGDNRGFSMDPSKTSRLSQITNYETDDGSSSTTAQGSRSVSRYGVEANSEAELIDNSSQGRINTHLFGNDDAIIPGADGTMVEDFQSPDIDLKTDLSISVGEADNDGNQILTISGTLTGDGFPSAESFVTDSKGNSVFVGVSTADFGQISGPFFALWGDTERKSQSVSVSIQVNSNGVFTGVRRGEGNIISIEEWNKNFSSTSPTK